ncbi:MAG: hypothetical protein V4510_04785 [bacterium]
MARLAPLALLFLFFTPATVQAEVPALSANEVRVEGIGGMEVDFAGAYLDAVPLLNPALVTLVADTGQMTLTEATMDIYAGQIGLTPAKQSNYTTALRGATATSFEPYSGVRLILVGEPSGTRAHAEAADLNAVPAPNSREFRARAAAGGWTVPSAGGVALQGDYNSTITIVGSFRFIVWDATFTLKNSTGNYAVRTGTVDEPVAGLPSGPVSRHVQREAVFDIIEGAVTLPRQVGLQLFASSVKVDLESGHIQVGNPSGINPVDGGEIASGSKILDLVAPFSMTLQGRGDSLALAFPIAPTAAELDGRAVRVPSSSPHWFGFGVLALVAIPAALAAGARAQNARRLRTLDRLMVSRESGQAITLARAIRKRHPRGEEALVAEAIGLVRQQQFGAASKLLEEGAWTGALQPLRDYLRACAAVGQGRRPAAVKALRACLASAPEMRADASANPLLFGILDEARRGTSEA